jgi:uncharacterized protein (TIGR03790 family)
MLLFVLLPLLLPVAAGALEPAEVLVIANRKADDSLALARLYMQKRSIPAENLLVLKTSTREICSRAQYDREIAAPLRGYLAGRSGRQPAIRCLVPMAGVPLKIGPSDKNRLHRTGILREEIKRLSEQLNTAEAAEGDGGQTIKKAIEKVRSEMAALQALTDQAAVDSELALVKAENYPLAGWVPNPFFYGFRNKTFTLVKKEQVLMVSRLDGPSPDTVRRVITDSLAAEARGLTGKAYFDARWKMPAERPQSGYALYDYSIHQAARLIRKSGLMPVVTDSSDSLFQKGQCPQAALYCGWYSLGKYVGAFAWQPGAVGYHIASSECTTLRNKNSRVWCKMMLEKGVAATIGPVYEPYVQAFPLPELFFSFLADGYLTLAECYLVSLPYLSWQMVLVGDPLYRPFEKRRQQ